MNIGIDARLINETGVGRYIRNLVREIGHQDKINEYTIFLKKKEYTSFELPNPRWKKVLADVGWHSVSEQLIMPWLLFQARLDLVHIPYFNIPIFYPGRMVATIHDLTILHFDTGRATTLPWILYKLRRVGYRIALAVGLRRVRTIIAVSLTTKKEIIDHLHVQPKKIVVTYEGVDEKVSAKGGPASGWKSQKSSARNATQSVAGGKVKSQKRIIENPYFLYVGNAYPHKNLEMLLRAFQQLTIDNSQLTKNLKLVLVGKDDFFYRKIKKLAASMNLGESVLYFGQADDAQLANLYAHAIAFVFPSLMEGFGLPALEALSFGCPVIVSDIPVFHEILGSQATYFNPQDPGDIAQKMSQNVVKPKNIILDGYSWFKLVSDTLRVYENI
ncbi:MAG: glycosyltransferase family 1 protein [Patescibacteria group bacterium]